MTSYPPCWWREICRCKYFKTRRIFP